MHGHSRHRSRASPPSASVPLRRRTDDTAQLNTVRSLPSRISFWKTRLCEIYDAVTELIERYKPDCMAIEELFFNINLKTAVDVCHGRGVILLAAAKKGLDVYEYTPLQIKQSVVGYGRAEKQQVMYMTKLLLGLNETPKPDDTADASPAPSATPTI